MPIIDGVCTYCGQSQAGYSDPAHRTGCAALVPASLELVLELQNRIALLENPDCEDD